MQETDNILDNVETNEVSSQETELHSEKQFLDTLERTILVDNQTIDQTRSNLHYGNDAVQDNKSSDQVDTIAGKDDDLSETHAASVEENQAFPEPYSAGEISGIEKQSDHNASSDGMVKAAVTANAEQDDASIEIGIANEAENYYSLRADSGLASPVGSKIAETSSDEITLYSGTKNTDGPSDDIVLYAGKVDEQSSPEEITLYSGEKGPNGPSDEIILYGGDSGTKSSPDEITLYSGEKDSNGPSDEIILYAGDDGKDGDRSEITGNLLNDSSKNTLVYSEFQQDSFFNMANDIGHDSSASGEGWLDSIDMNTQTHQSDLSAFSGDWTVALSDDKPTLKQDGFDLSADAEDLVDFGDGLSLQFLDFERTDF